MEWNQRFCNITVGWHVVLSHSSNVIPVHYTVHSEVLALLDLPLLFKLCQPVSHSIGNEMAWPRFTVAICSNWLRSLEQSWRDGNSWQHPGIHIRDPCGLEPIESQSHPILPALSTNILSTQGAQEPGCWVQEGHVLYLSSMSLLQFHPWFCTGLQPLYEARERLYLLEFNEVYP